MDCSRAWHCRVMQCTWTLYVSVMERLCSLWNVRGMCTDHTGSMGVWSGMVVEGHALQPGARSGATLDSQHGEMAGGVLVFGSV